MAAKGAKTLQSKTQNYCHRLTDLAGTVFFMAGGQSLQNMAYGFRNLLILDQDFQISEEDFRDFWQDFRTNIPKQMPIFSDSL